MLRERATLARERAARCAARASIHEAGLPTGEQSSQKWHEWMRNLFLRAMSQHLMSAEMHELLATRIEAWRSHTETGSGPGLVEVIAAQLGTASALATLSGHHSLPAMVVASDRTARAAHDLELVMAEGPATEASGGALVTEVGTTLVDRWPHYGPAVAELGIQAVCAAPLGTSRVGIGALCAYEKVP